MTLLRTKDRRRGDVERGQLGIGRQLERFALVGVWIIMIVTFGLLPSNNFLSVANFQIIFGTQSILLFLTLGLIVVLIIGEFDIAIAAVMGFANQLLAVLNVNLHINIALAILITLLVGLGIGCVHAFVTVGLGISSIVVTLGTSTLLTGIGQLITNTEVIAGVSSGWTSAVNDKYFGLPLVFYYGVLWTLLTWYVLAGTHLGRYLFFVGEGREVARLAGLPVNALRSGGLIWTALVSTIAGILLTGQVGSATPDTATSYLLPAFSAVYLGATAFTPGRFNAVGTFVAVYFLVTGFSGLESIGAASWVQDVFYGGSLIVAVAASRLMSRAWRSRAATRAPT